MNPICVICGNARVEPPFTITCGRAACQAVRFPPAYPERSGRGRYQRKVAVHHDGQTYYEVTVTQTVEKTWTKVFAADSKAHAWRLAEEDLDVADEDLECEDREEADADASTEIESADRVANADGWRFEEHRWIEEDDTIDPALRLMVTR